MADFSAYRPAEMPVAPEHLGISAGMTPLQMRAYLATMGTGSDLSSFGDPTTKDFYTQLLLHSMTDPQGALVGGAQLLPVENQFLQQAYGLDPSIGLEGLLTALLGGAGAMTPPAGPRQPRDGDQGTPQDRGGMQAPQDRPWSEFGPHIGAMMGFAANPPSFVSKAAETFGITGSPFAAQPTTSSAGTGMPSASSPQQGIDVATGPGVGSPGNYGGGGSSSGGMGAAANPPGGDAGTGGDTNGGDSGGMGCFVGNTEITMADGSNKKISDIRCDDEVMAFNGRSPLYPSRVVATQSRADAKTVVLSDGTECTGDHRFLTNQGDYVPISTLKEVENLTGIKDTGIEEKPLIVGEGRATVYNFTVEDAHTYVANGWRVHNIKHAGGKISEQEKPGTAQDVNKTLQEGEFVMSRDAVQAFGDTLFEVLNKAAKRKAA